LVWLPPYVFYNQGVPGISCAALVRDRAGRLRGVVSVDFDLNALSDFVAGLSVSEHSRVFLFTVDGTLLAHPHQPGMTAAGQGEAGKLLTLADTNDPLVDAFRQNLRPEYVRPGTGDAFHFLAFRQEGTDYLASASAFPIGDDQVWVVGVVAPEADFLAGVWRRQGLALAAAVGACLAAVLLAAALARRVSGPVQEMVGFMRRVGDGDLDARADFGGSREFRQVAAALNRMIADLRDRSASSRTRVRPSRRTSVVQFPDEGVVPGQLVQPGPPQRVGTGIADVGDSKDWPRLSAMVRVVPNLSRLGSAWARSAMTVLIWP
jgi:hypothetical protein